MKNNLESGIDNLLENSEENKPVFNYDEQEQRRKAKKRYISEGDPNTVMKGWYSVMGDPSGYIPSFRTYERALQELNDREERETQRRNKLIENYHNQDYPLDQFKNDLLGEFMGNKKVAFEWLLENARKR